jgi:DNA polymerase-3 subunit gamma/tau
MTVPLPVLVPPPLAIPEEMVLTEGDAIGEELMKAGDLADSGSLRSGGATLSAVETAAKPVDGQVNAQEVGRTDMQLPTLHSAEALQAAAISVLTGVRNQSSAADAMGDAEWTVTEGEIRVQTELSKTMLPMVINAEAEKLVKAALQKAGSGALKLMLLPGVKVEGAAKKKPKTAKSGSAQAKAMEHPVVQRAQTLFNAEIRSVIDLRDND